MTSRTIARLSLIVSMSITGLGLVKAADPSPKAFIDGSELGFRELDGDDFENVNCNEDTWTWDGRRRRLHGRAGGSDPLEAGLYEL